MSKFERYGDYPERVLAKAHSVFLTIWPGLSRYHEDLVLVGGLAVHCLTKAVPGGYPVAVTMDADLGIHLAAGGDSYGTLSSDLAGLGFQREADSGIRYYRDVEGVRIYLDFLTEATGAISGSRMVDDVVASVIPGINRALAARREIVMEGRDLYGAGQRITMHVAEIGPLLVLKLNAFGGPVGRRLPKDAFDILLLVMAFLDGSAAAIAGFHDEAGRDNPAHADAVRTLAADFSSEDADGPVRAAAFLGAAGDEARRVRQDMVTVARALLGK